MNGQLRKVSAGMLLASCALSLPASAVEFQWGDVEGSFNSQISIGASWRMESQDPRLVTFGNRPDIATTPSIGASTGTADDGNANFDDGDVYSLILKGVHDLELRKGDFGVFLRGKYWYDEELANGDRVIGNSANQYTPNQPLADSGFDDLAQASGIELLDAFVYGTWYLGENEAPLDIRLGRQVASWGESTFIQNGINSINPVDVSAFRRPGAEIKEGLLPVNMLLISTSPTDALTFEAFYQLEWEKTVIDGCGTYFSTNDVGATGCEVVTLTSLISDRFNMLGIPNPAVPGDFISPPGLFVSRLPDVEPDDDGQFGFNIRYFAEQLNGTEFGLYYMNYHSRTPYLGGFTSANPAIDPALLPPPLVAALTASLGPPPWPFIPGDPLAALGGGNPQYYAEFPEDIELYGASFATNFAGFAISGEISYRPDYPVQINATEILQGAVGYAPWSTVTPIVFAAGFGQPVSGYDELPFTQAQVTFIRFFDQVLGASRLSFAAEIGGNWVGSLPDQSVQRYGRNTIYGMGAFDPIPVTSLGIPIPGANLTCEGFFPPPPFDALIDPIIPNTNTSNCTNDGYVTDSSWGYRVRGSLTYNDVFAGINLTPNFAWSHDVDGVSPNTNFNEGAKALTLGINAEYLNRYTGSLSYTSFSGGDYNVIEDRDFLSFSIAVSF